MFVITADQKDSRSDIDRAGDVRRELDRRYRDALALPVDRTSGDEIQALVTDASAALAIVLDLTRREHWSVGLGIGTVRTPLPSATREATGPAFIAARDAVEAAKRSPTRFALAVGSDPGPSTGTEDAAAGTADATNTRDLPDTTGTEVEALVTLLLLARDRRTPQGWEVTDLIPTAGTQRDVATALGVTPQAVSTRLRTSGWRTEQAALPGLAKLLARLDSPHPRKDSPA